METLEPTALGTVVLSSGIALAMVWLGVQTNMLERRGVKRRCPSCGLLRERRGPCRCAG